MGAIASAAKARGALVHSDAVQAFGKIPLDMAALGLDLMSVSAHKIGGPQGVGALIARDVAPAPRLLGGAQERYRRAGTENVAGIAGFGVAAALAPQSQDCAPLRDRMEGAIRRMAPEAVLIAAGAPRLPNTSLIAMPGVSAESQVIALDLAGVAVSSGAACSSGKVRTSHVLDAMGLGALAGEAIRVSMGWATTDDDIERFLGAWTALRARTQGRGPARDAG